MKLQTNNNSSFLFQHNYWNLNIYSRRNARKFLWNINKKKLHYFESDNELKIFKTWNIEKFKVLYFKSIDFASKKRNWLNKISIPPGIFYGFNLRKMIKSIFNIFNPELKIFTKPSINKLRLNYFKNGGLSFEKIGLCIYTSENKSND